MSRLFAEIVDAEVARVVVCDDPAWLVSRLGGQWVETRMEDPVEQYAGPGMGIDLDSQYRFAPLWDQPTHAEDAYPLGAYVWHQGAIWQSQYPANVWEPGVAGWRDPISAVPVWRQPIGALDAYALDAEVMHLGRQWRSSTPDNVWEPGVYGWTDISPSNPDAVQEWVQPTGAHDAYQMGDLVLYQGQTWRSSIDANVWAPGVYGWVLA